MKNILTIFRREMHSYFTSPIAYVVLAVFLSVAGYFYYAILSRFIMITIQMFQQSQMYQQAPPKINVNLYMIAPLLQNLSVITIFIAPLITMRLISEEKKQGTIELLMTSPIEPWQWIIGKYLASISLYAVMILPPFLLVLALKLFGNPEFWPVISGFLGLALMGGSFLAMGLLISSLTENQIVAGVISFGAFLLLWVLDWIADAGGSLGKVISSISVLQHYYDFSKGIIDVGNILFYLSFIIFSIYLTYRSIDSIRWRV